MLPRSLRVHSLSHKVREATGISARRAPEPLVVGVCGGSGSGKTTFCDKLVGLLGPDKVLHLRQDDYYRDLSSLPPAQRDTVNFDHPESIEFSLLTAHLESLAMGREIAVPRYDFSTHTRTVIQQIVTPKPIILVEGILLFADSLVSSLLHHKIFIDASESVRFERRLRRDVRERGRTPESVRGQFETTVKPMHELFVEPKKLVADRIISGEVPFEPVLIDLCAWLLRGGGQHIMRFGIP